MIVIDASILANAVGDDHSDGVLAKASISSDPNVAAPDLIAVEAAAVLRKRWMAGQLSNDRLNVAIDAMIDLPLIIYPTAGLVKRAVQLRENVTAYDGVYVALAEALSAPLVTADRRLAAAPGPRCAFHVLG